MSIMDGGFGPIDLEQLSRSIEEAMAAMTPEQTAAFRAQFGDTGVSPEVRQQVLPIDTLPPEETEQTPEQAMFEFMQQREEAAIAQRRENAFARLTGYLSDYGLSDLDDLLRDLLARGIEEEGAVLYELRNTESFKKRFAANVARQQAGLPALTPRSYVDMENTYREVLRRGGMLEYFNRQDIFESLIAGDVSASELYDRITSAYQAVRDADPQTKAQMQTLYNVEEKDLAAYFLDPKTSVSALKRRAEAAKIAAAGFERAGMQLGVQTAEDLAARGFTSEQAAEAFSGISELSGLYQPLAGEEQVTEAEKIGAQFGYDTAAQQKLRRRAAVRKAEFSGGGTFAATRGATSGVVETGLGGPQ